MKPVNLGPQTLEGKEAEKSIASEWPADCQSGRDEPVARLVGTLRKVIPRGHGVRPEVGVGVAGKSVAATFGDYIDRCTGCEAELRGEPAAVDLKLLDRRHIERRSNRTGAILVFAAVNGQQIIATVVASDRKASGRPDETRVLRSRSVSVGDTWQREYVRGEDTVDVW